METWKGKEDRPRTWVQNLEKELRIMREGTEKWNGALREANDHPGLHRQERRRRLVSVFYFKTFKAEDTVKMIDINRRNSFNQTPLKKYKSELRGWDIKISSGIIASFHGLLRNDTAIKYSF